MRCLATCRPAQNRTQLVEAEVADQAHGNRGPGRNLVGKPCGERTQILEDLDHQIDELKFPGAARRAVRQAPVGEDRALVAAQEFGGMPELVADPAKQGLKAKRFSGAGVGRLGGVGHSRPTTASIAFFIVAVVKGFLTRLFRPNCCPFWMSSGVGVPVTRI